ncbi:MAG: glycosyltransferase family 39 protein [Pseudomonadota bacterium]
MPRAGLFLERLSDRLELGLDRLLAWAALAPWRGYLIVALVAVVTSLPGITELPVTDRDEGRFVQATKQMMETGDFIDIRFQEEPRWKKPVGIYWLQAGAATPFGATEAPVWAYRLPSMLAAILGAVATVWAARAILSPKASILAGLALTTTVLLAAEATIAKTDATLMLTAVLTLGALFRVLTGKAARFDWLIFWLAIAGSMLIKGPIVPTIAALAILATGIATRRLPPLAALRPVPGLVLTAAIVGPWLIAIWEISGGGFFEEAVGRDLLGKVAEGQEAHWGPPGLYAAIVWGTFWPAASLLPAALASGWAARRDSTAILMIAAWVVPFWLMLEVVQTKLPHYVLPLYPALAMLVAWHVTQQTAPRARWLRIAAGVVAALPGVVLGLAAITLPLVLEGRLIAGAALFGLAAGGMAIVAGHAALHGRQRAQLAGGGLSAMLAITAVLQFGLPGLDTAFGTPQIAALARPFEACRSGPLVSAGYREPSLVFATETTIRMPGTRETARIIAEEPGAVILLEEGRRNRLDRALTERPDAPRMVGHASVSYFNYNRGDRETVTLMTRDDPRFAPCIAALGNAAQPLATQQPSTEQPSSE